MMDFRSQRVVITGGSSGIGREVARRVVAQGGSVVLIGRNLERLESTAAELGPRAEGTVLDVTIEEDVEACFSRLGEFDHLVTAAAGTLRGTVAELSISDAKGLFDSKFWGQYSCVKYAIPLIKSTGSITLFSGWISRKPAAGVSTLAAVDGAIESLARTLALELGPIRVNAITPGRINTPLWGARLTSSQQQAYFETIGRSLPVGRAGTAEDIAHAVLFLMQNGFTTGTILDVDGGER